MLITQVVKLSIAGICLVYLFAPSTSLGQDNAGFEKVDSLNAKKQQVYPSFRLFQFSLHKIGAYKYESEILDEKYEQGKLGNNYRFQGYLNFPIMARKKVMLMGSAAYLYEQFKFEDIRNVSTRFAKTVHKENISVHDFVFSLNAIYIDSVSGKKVIFSGGPVIDLQDLHNITRFRFQVSAMMLMKQNRKNSLSLGLAYMYDRSSPFPVFPIVNYWHRFGRSGWEFNTVVPQMFAFRRPVLTNGWLTVGAEMTGVSFFQNSYNVSQKDTYEYRYTNLLSFLNIEYPIFRWVMLGVKGGLRTNISSRLLKLDAKNRDFLYSAKPEMAPFIDFSFSVIVPKKK